jgi:hypothetical protein
MSARAYCPSCRAHFHVDRNPPYAVTQVQRNPDVDGDADIVHVHPITGEVLFQLRGDDDELPNQGP